MKKVYCKDCKNYVGPVYSVMGGTYVAYCSIEGLFAKKRFRLNKKNKCKKYEKNGINFRLRKIYNRKSL